MGKDLYLVQIRRLKTFRFSDGYFKKIYRIYKMSLFPIHKMGWTKPKYVPEKRTQPASVWWLTCEGMWDVKYRPQRQLGGLRWEFFAQEEKTIKPQENVFYG